MIAVWRADCDTLSAVVAERLDDRRGACYCRNVKDPGELVFTGCIALAPAPVRPASLVSGSGWHEEIRLQLLRARGTSRIDVRPEVELCTVTERGTALAEVRFHRGIVGRDEQSYPFSLRHIIPRSGIDA